MPETFCNDCWDVLVCGAETWRCPNERCAAAGRYHERPDGTRVRVVTRPAFVPRPAPPLEPCPKCACAAGPHAGQLWCSWCDSVFERAGGDEQQPGIWMRIGPWRGPAKEAEAA